MTLSALIFDVDGTLADTEDAHREAFNSTFAAAGHDWNWDRDLYTQLLNVTGGKARIRFFLENHHPDLLAGEGIADHIVDLHKQKTAFYVEAMQSGRVPLRPGVERLLRQARSEGLTLAIATTTTPVNFRSLIESTLGREALDWFTAIGAGNCVENLKPAPDIYLWVLDRLGLDPSRCLAFEDSANGLKAATGAGLQALITHCPYTRDHDFTGALAVLSGLGEPEDGEACVDVEFLRRLHG
ncbi:MAG: HAD-IA family hydrolase [Rhodospirillales bacterium]|nr:HAD-IA family hydrolase [Rhodospirillales bacterium]